MPSAKGKFKSLDHHKYRDDYSEPGEVEEFNIMEDFERKNSGVG
jgi:hypothetical protein